MGRLRIAAAAAGIVLAFPAVAAAGTIGDPTVAALQVALASRGLYGDTIDGLAGPATAAGLAAFEEQAGLPVDGALDRRAAAALGRRARGPLGTRALTAGSTGWDVASLQFLLAWHGFPSGELDGVFGERLDHSLRRFQRWAGLAPDGVAGPATAAALRRPPAIAAIRLAWPLDAPVGDAFGPRGTRFHAGIDLPATKGAPVGAARGGRVSYAGRDPGGWGKYVVVAHGGGVRTLYAHLSRIDVAVGERVRSGERIGRVGSTGRSTGPHLHFEVRLRGAAVDPLASLA